MSCTKSFSLSLRPPLLSSLFYLAGFAPVAVWPQAVPSQANIDASAQRRLQETAREAQRQRRIEEQIRNLAPALDPEKLAQREGPVLVRKALAALIHLREEGIPADEALARAARAAKIQTDRAAKPSAYLRNLAQENSPALTSALLEKLEAGEDPTPKLNLPPYQP